MCKKYQNTKFKYKIFREGENIKKVQKHNGGGNFVRGPRSLFDSSAFRLKPHYPDGRNTINLRPERVNIKIKKIKNDDNLKKHQKKAKNALLSKNTHS